VGGSLSVALAALEAVQTADRLTEQSTAANSAAHNATANHPTSCSPSTSHQRHSKGCPRTSAPGLQRCSTTPDSSWRIAAWRCTCCRRRGRSCPGPRWQPVGVGAGVVLLCMLRSASLGRCTFCRWRRHSSRSRTRQSRSGSSLRSGLRRPGVGWSCEGGGLVAVGMSQINKPNQQIHIKSQATLQSTKLKRQHHTHTPWGNRRPAWLHNLAS